VIYQKLWVRVCCCWSWQL